MAFNNVVYEWEGDSTQPFKNMQWESSEVVANGRVRLSVARILFDVGDLAAFWDTVKASDEIIARNAATRWQASRRETATAFASRLALSKPSA